MFAFRDRLSYRMGYWLGFLVCPLLMWLFLTAPILLVWYIGYPGRSLRALPDGVLLCLAGSWFLSLLTLAIFCGFAAAFFWKEFQTGDTREDTIGVCSVALTWIPGGIMLDALWYIALVLFLISWGLYQRGLHKGHRFWESNRPRQFLGDFSELDVSDTK